MANNSAYSTTIHTGPFKKFINYISTRLQFIITLIHYIFWPYFLFLGDDIHTDSILFYLVTDYD